jgi:hypothetical protein
MHGMVLLGLEQKLIAVPIEVLREEFATSVRATVAGLTRQTQYLISTARLKFGFSGRSRRELSFHLVENDRNSARSSPSAAVSWLGARLETECGYVS